MVHLWCLFPGTGQDAVTDYLGIDATPLARHGRRSLVHYCCDETAIGRECPGCAGDLIIRNTSTPSAMPRPGAPNRLQPPRPISKHVWTTIISSSIKSFLAANIQSQD